MKKLMLTIFSLMLASMLGVASAQNPDISQEREVTDYTSMAAMAGIRVEISGKHSKITVVGDPESVGMVSTYVENSTLKIKFDQIGGLFRAKTKKNVTVYVPKTDFYFIEASSGATVLLPDGYSGGSTLSLITSSGGQISGSIKGKHVRMSVSSSGDIRVRGKVDEISADASSGGTISAEELESKTARCNASTGGRIRANVSELLDVEASTGGVVEYRGNAALRNTNISTGGTLNKLNY